MVLKYFGYFLLGLLSSFSLLLVLVLTLPILFYRLVVCYIIAPIYRPDIVKMVEISGQAFAIEFLPNKKYLPPRSTSILGLVLDRPITTAKITELVQTKWITALKEGGEVDELMYPELQQYIDQWLGFMFWKRDKNFQLENHVIEHYVGQSATSMESKMFVDGLIEELLNKKYSPGRSPWDLHIVHDYKDPELKMEGMTVLLFRCHHAMADGFSIHSLLQEALMETPLSSNTGVHFETPKRKAKAGEDFLKIIKFILRIMSDIGFAVSLQWGNLTPWHCPDKIKHWKQLYARSPMIPIQKIKFIKDKLGCSFVGVILSSISAGAAYSFQQKEDDQNINTVYTGVPLPLPGHPKKLCNHFSGTVLELPTGNTPSPLERLSRMEEKLEETKHSTLPFLMPLARTLASFPLARIVQALVTNKVLSTGFANLRGPYTPLVMEDSTLRTLHACTGAFLGCAGVSLAATSYMDHVCISAVVEAALMDHYDLEQFFQRVCQEIDNLYRIALKK